MGKVTIELSEETASFLKNLVDEMESQNNRATASPLYFVVKLKKKICGLASGYGDGREWVDMSSGCYESYASEAEAKDAIKKDDPEADVDKVFQDCFEEFGYTYSDDREENVFFTYKGFLEHMRLNAHNYPTKQDGDKFKENEWVFSYGKHAFRNPEMQNLFKSLFEIRDQIGK